MMHPTHLAAADRPEGAGMQPKREPAASPLREALAALSLAVAAAGAVAPAPALGQARVVPLLLADPDGPDLGPVEGQVSNQISVSSVPSGVGAVVQTQGQVLSGVNYQFSLVALLGSNGLESIARRFDPVAGQEPGTVFGLLHDVQTNRNGQAVFVDDSPQELNDARLWAFDRNRNFVSVARLRRAAPGVSNGFFRAFLSAPRINDAGDVLFGAQLDRGNASGSLADQGLWTGQPGRIAPLARTGMLAPGLTGVERFLFSASATVDGRLNTAGECAFTAGYSRDDIFVEAGFGLWTGTPGALTLTISSGQRPPSPYPADSVIEYPEVRDWRDSGVLLAKVTARRENGASVTGHIVGRTGQFNTLVLVGQPLPGAPAPQVFERFAFQTEPRMNDAGEAVFAGLARSPSNFNLSTAGIWTTVGGGALRPVVLGGEATGVGTIRFRFGDFLSPVIDERGEIVFGGMVSNNGPVNWLWHVQRDGARRPILRPGDTVTFPDGSVRAITAINGGPGPIDRRGWFSANVLFGRATGVVLVNARVCDADFNASGTLDPDDLADFIAGFFSVPSDRACDFNLDGSVDPDDLSDFIAAFFGGC